MRVSTSPGIDDLLDGLEGTARTGGARLVRWLLEQGTGPTIRAANPSLLPATRHLIGDDGSYLSARRSAHAKAST